MSVAVLGRQGRGVMWALEELPCAAQVQAAAELHPLWPSH